MALRAFPDQKRDKAHIISVAYVPMDATRESNWEGYISSLKIRTVDFILNYIFEISGFHWVL